ncbi:MAG TPA: metallophosphoesterase [Candidatus Dormibacteraeota bacterium]|nr:metallophosphoesterase [Candidatus Dormibacteraeota bacterium]
MAESRDLMTHLDEAGRALVDREVDRRGFLKCASWVGAGTIWTVSGGLVAACGTALTGQNGSATDAPTGLYFVQISDSHIGFQGTANPDVLGSFTKAVAQVNALPNRPAFVIHTGDLTHTSTPEQFNTVKDVLGTLKTPQVVVVPGEHDTVMGPKPYLDVFGAGTQGDGWSSFDMGGIHFLSLNNVVDVVNLGHLGTAQLEFIQKDVAGLKSDTPIVVFAHIPMWTIYEKWGWGTDDAAQALSYLKRFASVTLLNGHIHQIISKVEGNVTYSTATTTAYPLPAPGAAPAPAPLTVPAGKLHDILGIREVRYRGADRGFRLTDDHNL